MKVLGLIIARKGSVGLPGKNLKKVGGHALCEWVSYAGLRAQRPQKILLSTDDEKVQELCRNLGVEVPFTRPAHLCNSTAKAVDVMIHALEWEKAHGRSYDYLLLLQPTSPFVSGQDIDQAIDLAVKKNADTVISSSTAAHFQFSRLLDIDLEHRVRWWSSHETEKMPRRQDEKTWQLRSGLFYVVKVSLLLNQHTLYGPRTYALEVPAHRALCIDGAFDLDLAQFIAQKYGLSPTATL